MLPRLVALLILSFVLLGFAPAQPAAAVDVIEPVCESVSGGAQPAVCADDSTDASDNENPVASVLKTAVRVIAFVVGFVSVVIMIIAGIKMAASNGDSKSFADGRRAILYAVIAILIAVLAYSMVGFVVDKLPG
jgi:cytochrome c biogenesis protein CcdA